MDALLNQFIVEGKELLQRVYDVLIELEEDTENKELLDELFRVVHTLKGNSGLFNFGAMTKLLHASEDLMNKVREGEISYNSDIADVLLEAMDIVSAMMDEIASNETISHELSQKAQEKADHIRAKFLAFKSAETHNKEDKKPQSSIKEDTKPKNIYKLNHKLIPENIKKEIVKAYLEGKDITFVKYSPEEECFFKGEDPLYLVRATPNLLWARGYLREDINAQDPLTLDIYKCITDFEIIGADDENTLSEHFNYVSEQVRFFDIDALSLVVPEGTKTQDPMYEDFVSSARKLLEENDIDSFKKTVESFLEWTSPDSFAHSVAQWLKVFSDYLPKTKPFVYTLLKSIETLNPPVFKINPDENKLSKTPTLSKESMLLLETQLKVLENLKEINDETFKTNTFVSVLNTVKNLLKAQEQSDLLKTFEEIASSESIDKVEEFIKTLLENKQEKSALEKPVEEKPAEEKPEEPKEKIDQKDQTEKKSAAKVLKVDESRIDKLMNLVGELVIAKNSIPYLAKKVADVYGMTDLSKEIKSQYAVFNRISEELQDAVMQIRMVTVSTVFQRFPRLVRDISKKLNKKVKLIIEGEETEADKDVIEALSDPLIHIVRNSLDHGLEPPEERIQKGKPETGTIILRAKQEGDHVIIECEDDGRGIDPNKVKQKAYQKGLISEEQLSTMSDDEAIKLIFLPGFSTAEVTTELSGRGVGMDVVRRVVEEIGGSVNIKSVLGKGTTISISLPLSMAVSNIMLIETAGERFGIPIDYILETIKISKRDLHSINGKMVSTVRGKIVPFVYLNDALDIQKPHLTDEDGNYLSLILMVNKEYLGIIVDKFHGTADIILKPFEGFLKEINIFSGSAIMGDGSVLLVINPKELVRWE